MAERRVGVIAEDRTDADTIAVLVRRLLGSSVGVERRGTGGCSMLRRKMTAWSVELLERGCRCIVVVHDLDRTPTGDLRDEQSLRRELEAKPVPAGVQRHICIPIEELEAWFWADQATLAKVGSGKSVAHPHTLRGPKEALIRSSRAANGRPRYSTVDNPALAESLDLVLCARRCPSFKSLQEFLAQESDG